MSHPTPSTEIRLFDPQADALESGCRELLVGGSDRPAGASFLLRAAGIVIAASTPGVRVVLAKLTADDVRAGHVEGDSGIAALVGDMQRHGACTMTASEVRFAQGGTLAWTGPSRASPTGRSPAPHAPVAATPRTCILGLWPGSRKAIVARRVMSSASGCTSST